MYDAILSSDLAFLGTVDKQAEVIEEKIVALAAEKRRVRLLMTMTSIGYFTGAHTDRGRRHRQVPR